MNFYVKLTVCTFFIFWWASWQGLVVVTFFLVIGAYASIHDEVNELFKTTNK